MKYEPLVSIVIPVYNGSNYLREAIDSALKQTYQNIEILVVNDGSSDDGASERIALSYGDKIRYFHKENGGVSSALNLAIRKMRGEWLSWLSHDDIYKPNKIEVQIKYLDNLLQINCEYNIHGLCLYGATERINAEGKFISKKSFHIPACQNAKDALFFHIKSYRIGGCTVLMSKECLTQVGGFDEKLRTVSDADLWFRMMRAGYSFHFINQIIVQSRQHKQQVGNRSLKLFEEEHRALMMKLTCQLLEESLTVNEKYALLEGLVINGFEEAAKLVQTNLKKNKQTRGFKTFKINFILRPRRKMFLLIRWVYRKLTLK